MQRIQACLFDLDGVIVDTAKFHYLAWKRLANTLGFDLTLEENEKLKGIGRMESLDIILGIGNVTLSSEEKLKHATAKNTHYLELCMQMTPADTLPGVKAFLESLQQNRIKIGLGSASKNALLILNQIGMGTYFEALIDGNRTSKGKPDPEVFLLGAADLQVLPQHCVVFEDAVAGIQAAKAGNMMAIGVGNPTTLSEADFVIPGFSDFTVSQMLNHFPLV
jgi:beta-phosphoglucomutase